MTMRILLFLSLLVLTVGTWSCKKSGGQPTQPLEEPGEVRPHGTPLHGAVRKTIGPEGGSLTSADGVLLLEVPTGALASATEISVQQVTRTLPGGVGPSYRLLPESVKFSKPVKLTYAYHEHWLDSTAAEVLFMAYQDEGGIWKMIPRTQLNQAAKTLTVETGHFSDWTPYALFWLHAEKRILRVGETTNLAIYATAKYYDMDMDKPEIVIARAEVIKKPGNIRNWSAPAGQLSAAGDIAVYTAPGNIPVVNPVPVSVEVHNFIPPQVYDERGGAQTRLILTQDILVTSDTYFYGTINGTEFMALPEQHHYVIGGLDISLGGNYADGEGFVITIHGVGNRARTGTFPWFDGDSDEDNSSKATLAHVRLHQGPRQHMPKSWWVECGDPYDTHRASPGSVAISKLDIVNGVTYIEGTLSANLWDHWGQICGMPKVSEVTIFFRLAPHPGMSDGFNLSP